MEIKIHPVYKLLVTPDGVVIGKKGKPLKPSIGNGYHVVGICFDGKYVQRKVHRLVVETYIGKIPEGYCVNHKDGDKLNNCLDNLEIVTFKENTQHAYRTGLAMGRKGSENAGSKLLLDQVLEIYDMIKNGKSNEEIGEKFNLHNRYISLMRHGKRWSHIYKLYFSNSAPLSTGSLSLPIDFCLKVLDTCMDKSKTNTQIAIEYGIDQSTISRIRNKKTWKSIWWIYDSNVTTIENTSKKMEVSRVHCKPMTVETEGILLSRIMI